MKTRKFLNGKFDLKMLGIIFFLAWPTMLEQFMQTAVQYIDTAMVGSLGTKATAAVGSTGTVNWLVGSTVSAVGIGFLAFISQAIGAGDHQKARKASAQSVLSVITVGLALTVITQLLSSVIPVWMNVDVTIRQTASQYFRILYMPMLFRAASIIFGTVLRAAGDTKTPMRVGVAVNVINVVFNFVLIYPTRSIRLFSSDITVFGAGMGVEGAALASAIAYAFGGIAVTVALWRHSVVSPRGQRMTPDISILKPCLKVAIPNMLQRFATSFGYVVFASMINALGDVSTAAHTVANTVESAFYIPGWGMQTAAATLAGNAYGANDEKRLRKLSATVIPLEVLLMTVSGALLFIFAGPLVGLFSKDAEVISLGTTVLRMVAISEPFYGVPIVIEGMMQGTGKTVKPLIYNVFGMWCVRIVGTYICTAVLGMGLVSAWACMIAHNMTLFVLFGVRFIKENQRKN